MAIREGIWRGSAAESSGVACPEANMKRMRFIFLTMVALGATGFASAASNAGANSGGAKLFASRCSGCHGEGGKGGSGPSLRKPLRHGNTVPTVAAVISNGIPDSAMPPSGMSDAANRQLAHYILSLQKKRDKKR